MCLYILGRFIPAYSHVYILSNAAGRLAIWLQAAQQPSLVLTQAVATITSLLTVFTDHQNEIDFPLDSGSNTLPGLFV